MKLKEIYQMSWKRLIGIFGASKVGSKINMWGIWNIPCIAFFSFLTS